MSSSDPRDPDPREAQENDPQSGASDDPRVDPTPDRRHSDVDTDADTASGDAKHA